MIGYNTTASPQQIVQVSFSLSTRTLPTTSQLEYHNIQSPRCQQSGLGHCCCWLLRHSHSIDQSSAYASTSNWVANAEQETPKSSGRPASRQSSVEQLPATQYTHSRPTSPSTVAVFYSTFTAAARYSTAWKISVSHVYLFCYCSFVYAIIIFIHQ